ncbi:hypothetical protein F4806DRAFT_444616 [Annulohypoxylon nitens]|nr:hypothetical protein F4806DRAFT_444616 [Annulohypoxylon nitens]
MSIKSLWCLRRLSLHPFLQPAIRPSANVIHHAPRTPKLRHLSSTPPRHGPRTRFTMKQTAAQENKSRGGSADSFSGIPVSESELPSLTFWKKYAVPPLVPPGTVTPEECDEVCREYVALFTADPSSRPRTLPEFLTLHYIAGVIMSSSTGRFGLSLHILHQLIRQDYAPSILTLSNVAVKGGYLLSNIRFAYAKDGLEVLSRGTTNYRLDALTLLGQAYGALNTPEDDLKALKFLTTAEEVFAEKPYIPWVWHASAVLAQSEIYMRQKRPDLARELFKKHAQRFDKAEVHYAYAMLLPESDPERMHLLEQAAISVCPPAARELARIEQQRAKEPGLSKRDRRDFEVLADEWLMIAGDKEIA